MVSLCAEAGRTYDIDAISPWDMIGCRRIAVGEEFSRQRDFVAEALAALGARGL